MVQIHQSEDKQLPNQCTCPGEPPTQVEIYNSRNAFIFQGKKEKQDTTTSLHKCWLQSPDVNVTTTALERKLYLKNGRSDLWPWLCNLPALGMWWGYDLAPLKSVFPSINTNSMVATQLWAPQLVEMGCSDGESINGIQLTLQTGESPLHST